MAVVSLHQLIAANFDWLSCLWRLRIDWSRVLTRACWEKHYCDIWNEKVSDHRASNRKMSLGLESGVFIQGGTVFLRTVDYSVPIPRWEINWPKTPDGLARATRANWKHGQYSQEEREYRKAIAKLLRDASELSENIWRTVMTRTAALQLEPKAASVSLHSGQQMTGSSSQQLRKLTQYQARIRNMIFLDLYRATRREFMTDAEKDGGKHLYYELGRHVNCFYVCYLQPWSDLTSYTTLPILR